MAIYTIGYSGYSPTKLVQKLHELNITVLVDVRSVPFSAHFPQYNKDQLEALLKKENILYRNYAAEFGARQAQPEFCTDGQVDFIKFSASPVFRSGIRKILSGMDLGYTFVLMCAEKDPIICHRSILVARAFHQMVQEVIHLTPEGEEPHTHLEQRLLDLYFLERDQLSLLDTQTSDKDLLAQAYQLQNREIGYRLTLPVPEGGGFLVRPPQPSPERSFAVSPSV